MNTNSNLIIVLLNPYASEEERQQSANTIINNYNLPLTIEQTVFAFHEIRKYIEPTNIDLNTHIYNEYLLVLSTLVNENINMFVAILLGLNADYNVAHIRCLYNPANRKTIGIGNTNIIIFYFC